jgi:hypothetical protein
MSSPEICIQSTGDNSRFRSSSLPLSSSSSHLLFTAFLICLDSSGVISDGEGAGGGAVGVDGLAIGVDGWGDDDGAGCTFMAAKTARTRLRRRRRLAPERVAALLDEGRRQVIRISCCPEECLTLTHALRLLITQRSYKARKSAAVVAATAAVAVAADGVGGKLMHAQSHTTLAQLGTAFKTGLTGKSQQITPSGLADQPSTPLLGEAGVGLGQLSPSLPGWSAFRPTRGGGGGQGLGEAGLAGSVFMVAVDSSSAPTPEAGVGRWKQGCCQGKTTPPKRRGLLITMVCSELITRVSNELITRASSELKQG